MFVLTSILLHNPEILSLWKGLIHPCFSNGKTWTSWLRTLSTLVVTIGDDYRTGTHRKALRSLKTLIEACLLFGDGRQRVFQQGDLVAAAARRIHGGGLSTGDYEVAFATCCFTTWKAIGRSIFVTDDAAIFATTAVWSYCSCVA